MQHWARRMMVGTVFLAAAAGSLWLGLNFQGLIRILLVALAVLLAMPAIAGIFNPRVLGGVIAIAVTGALLGGSIAMADSETTAIQVIGFVFVYVTWLGFSGCLFGTPIIVIPFPPFFIFTWQELSEEQHKDMGLRFLAIGLMVAIATGVANLPRWSTEASLHTTDSKQWHDRESALDIIESAESVQTAAPPIDPSVGNAKTKPKEEHASQSLRVEPTELTIEVCKQMVREGFNLRNTQEVLFGSEDADSLQLVVYPSDSQTGFYQATIHKAERRIVSYKPIALASTGLSPDQFRECPECQRVVRMDETNCPYCAIDLSISEAEQDKSSVRAGARR